jgi:hypothetical protein
MEVFLKLYNSQEYGSVSRSPASSMEVCSTALAGSVTVCASPVRHTVAFKEFQQRVYCSSALKTLVWSIMFG